MSDQLADAGNHFGRNFAFSRKPDDAARLRRHSASRYSATMRHRILGPSNLIDLNSGFS
jgi:hypothetical protein